MALVSSTNRDNTPIVTNSTLRTSVIRQIALNSVDNRVSLMERIAIGSFLMQLADDVDAAADDMVLDVNILSTTKADSGKLIPQNVTVTDNYYCMSDDAVIPVRFTTKKKSDNTVIATYIYQITVMAKEAYFNGITSVPMHWDLKSDKGSSAIIDGYDAARTASVSEHSGAAPMSAKVVSSANGSSAKPAVTNK